MLFILDGNLDIGAHVRSNLSLFIWLRHLIRSKAIKNRSFLIKTISFMREQHHLSYHWGRGQKNLLAKVKKMPNIWIISIFVPFLSLFPISSLFSSFLLIFSFSFWSYFSSCPLFSPFVSFFPSTSFDILELLYIWYMAGFRFVAFD